MAVTTIDTYKAIIEFYDNLYTKGFIDDAYLNGIKNIPEDKFFEVIGNFSNSFYNVKSGSGVTTGTVYSKNAQKIFDEIGEIANKVDSNVQPSTTVNVKVPLNNVKDGENVRTTPGAVAKSGATVKSVFASVGQALVAASVGIALGKQIDKTLYNLNPDFFDAHGMSGLNPDTWSEITEGQTGLAAGLFNAILGIEPETNEVQTYITQEAFAYMAAWLNSKGAFDVFDGFTNTIGSRVASGGIFVTSSLPCYIESRSSGGGITKYPYSTLDIEVDDGTIIAFQTIYVYNGDTDNPSYYGNLIVVSDHENPTWSVILNYGAEDGKIYSGKMSKSSSDRSYTYEDKTVYYFEIGGNAFILGPTVQRTAYAIYGWGKLAGLINGKAFSRLSGSSDVFAWSARYSDIVSTPFIAGMPNQNGSKIFTASKDLTIDEVLEQLKIQYPELFEKSITNTVLQPDGTYKDIVYVPIPTAEAETRLSEEPTSGSATQTDTTVNPNTSSSTLIDLITGLIGGSASDGGSPNPPPTGAGDTPPTVIPVGQASTLFAVYNPTQSELNEFGAWLWNSDFIEQLKKLFNDPMQSIIGLHKVFVAPPVNGIASIVVGYLDSGIAVSKVSSQYTTVDCGTVSLLESFQNVFDYYPYTSIKLHLPFVGIVDLDPSDVMRGVIGVKYNVDVITGAGLAEVSVTRDGSGGVLYTFPCDCRVTYPISSGSYLGTIMGSIGGAISGGLSFGVPGLVVGAGLSSLSHPFNVSHTGQFTGNSGAMGIKRPYLIISRPQTFLADNFQHFEGKPTNYTVILGDCSGYIKVSSVHVDNISATLEELSEIEDLLKNGVII